MKKFLLDFLEKLATDKSFFEKKIASNPLEIITSFGNSQKNIFYLNARTIGLLNVSKKYKEAFSSASILYVDGWGAVFFLKMLGLEVGSRNTAPDFFDALCEEMIKRKKSIFFVGGKRDVINKFIKKLSKRHPKLMTVGFNHGFFINDDLMVKKINKVSPDLLVLGMGANSVFSLPRQELWSTEFGKKIKATNIWCVGNLFENYISDKIMRPKNKKWYFEWLSRIILNPKKMLVRSFLDISLYLYAILMLIIRNIFLKK